MGKGVEKVNSDTLLMGMSEGTSTVENSLAILKKKHETTM